MTQFFDKEYYLCLLYDNRIEPELLSEEASHYRFKMFDFWLTKKQKFTNKLTNQWGNGIENLIIELKKYI